MDKTISIVVCGVGGQGILLSSDLISIAALESGFDVKKSEVHGMAQRGGAVISFVRFGKKVYSPLVEEGTADFILAFEKAEALRNSRYAKVSKDTIYIVNDLEIIPTSVSLGYSKYPQEIEKKINEFSKKVYFVNALSIAKELGEPRAANVVLIGVLSKFIEEIPNEMWIKAIRMRVPEKAIEVNIKAFEKGKSLV